MMNNNHKPEFKDLNNLSEEDRKTLDELMMSAMVLTADIKDYLKKVGDTDSSNMLDMMEAMAPVQEDLTQLVSRTQIICLLGGLAVAAAVDGITQKSIEDIEPGTKVSMIKDLIKSMELRTRIENLMRTFEPFDPARKEMYEKEGKTIQDKVEEHRRRDIH